MDIELGKVREAKYWCRKHNCELMPNMMSAPARTAEEVGERLDVGLEEAETVMQVLRALGHTTCKVDPDSWKMPDIMLGEGNFTCPRAEAEFGFTDYEYSTDPDEDLGKALQADWPYWVMVVNDD